GQDESPAAVVATAALFHHWPDAYEARFKQLFHVDRSIPPHELSTEAVNAQVNALLAEFRGRHPLEVSARLYLQFRRSGQYAVRTGAQLFLEMTFRGSVFTGIAEGSKQRVLELAGIADGGAKADKPAEPARSANGSP